MFLGRIPARCQGRWEHRSRARLRRTYSFPSPGILSSGRTGFCVVSTTMSILLAVFKFWFSETQGDSLLILIILLSMLFSPVIPSDLDWVATDYCKLSLPHIGPFQTFYHD